MPCRHPKLLVFWVVFLFYTLPAVLSIPFWVWLGKRYERHKLWRYAMGLQAFGYGGIVFQDEGRIGLMIFCSLGNPTVASHNI